MDFSPSAAGLQPLFFIVRQGRVIICKTGAGFLAREGRSVDSEQWSVDSCQWTVDSGQCSVNSVQWTVDSGL